MADRRMFHKSIITSDAFIEMPATAKCLYFSLNIYADDDGFVNSPRQIMRMIYSSDDDMKILIAKKFVIVFEDGVLVIKHWRIHNYIQKDRYVPTKYQEHLKELTFDENKSYKIKEENALDTDCIQDGYRMDTQVRLGKDRLGKDNIVCNTHAHTHEDFFNNIPTLEEITDYIKLKDYKNIDAQRFKDYYDALGWKKGNTPITNWMALLGMWEREQVKQDGLKSKVARDYQERTYTKEELESVYTDIDAITEQDL